jgi:hypothetical protein
MLCDLILEVRASRMLSADQVARIERAIDGCALDRHELDLLFLLDRYAERAHPSWWALLARAVAAAETGPARLPAAA